MHQITVDEANDDLGHLRLRRKRVEEPYLYILIIAEAARYGKDHSQDGHDSQQRGIGKRRGLIDHTLGGKETDSQ